jgi:hypothetical protein
MFNEAHRVLFSVRAALAYPSLILRLSFAQPSLKVRSRFGESGGQK